MKKLRALFFWTPGLSANILTYLMQQDGLDIIGVVSTPDKPAGRGHQMIASPVAQLAREKNMTLLQPEKIREENFLNKIREMQPDICIVVAYGKILPQVLLDIPPMGFLNVHTSLLPKYRGAAPIQHALLDGEKQTGLTVQQMALGMDEGDILVQETWDISSDDTTGSLFARTGERAGPLLMEALEWLVEKTITPIPQDPSEATYAKMIEKKDGELQLSWTVDEAYHAWQAYTPWPSLFTFFWDMKISLLKVKKMTNEKIPPSPKSNPSPTLPEGEGVCCLSPIPLSFGEGWGERFQGGINEEFFIINKLPAIALQDGYIILEQVHPAGKKPMTGEEFVRGFMWKVKGEK